MAPVPLLSTVALSENMEDGVDGGVTRPRTVSRASPAETGTPREKMMGIVRGAQDHSTPALRAPGGVLGQEDCGPVGQTTPCAASREEPRGAAAALPTWRRN